MRATKEMKEKLVEASKASGRSLAQEIEARLQRTLEEDQPKTEAQLQLLNLTRDIIELVRRNWEGREAALPAPVVLIPTPKKSKSKSPRTAQLNEGEPGQPGRLLPSWLSVYADAGGDISVVRRDDGRVMLFSCRNGLIIGETPLDIATAQWLAGELRAAAKPKPRSKLQWARRSQAAPDSVTPVSRKTAGSSDGA